MAGAAFAVAACLPDLRPKCGSATLGVLVFAGMPTCCGMAGVASLRGLSTVLSSPAGMEAASVVGDGFSDGACDGRCGRLGSATDCGADSVLGVVPVCGADARCVASDKCVLSDSCVLSDRRVVSDNCVASSMFSLMDVLLLLVNGG